MKQAILLLASAFCLFGQKPLDLVLILEPVEWGDASGGKLSRSAEDLRMRPDDRLCVIELINGPKVKSKLGEGRTVVGMRWRPTFRFGAQAAEPESRARRIYDALLLATKQFPGDAEPNRQRAVLLVTADEEFASKAKPAEVRAALEAARANLVMLVEPEQRGVKRIKRGVSVGDVVRESGGVVAPLEGMESLAPAVASLRR